MQKKLVIRQQGIKECGASCLLSVIRYYKGNISLTKLLELTNTNKNGTTFYDLRYASNYLGLPAEGYKLDKLSNEIKTPFISQVLVNNYTHFIVVYEIKKDSLLIMDPGQGSKVIKLEYFYKTWTGNIMIFNYNKKLPIITTENYIKNIIINVLSKNKILLTNIFILSIIFTLLTIINSYQMKFILAKFSVSTFVISFIYIILMRSLANVFKNILLSYLNIKLDISIFASSIDNIIYFPYSYYKNKTTGEVTSKLSDISYIRNLISKIILTVLLDFLILIIAGIFLYSINKFLFLLSLLIVLIYVITMLLLNPYMNKLVKKDLENNSIINTNLIESITNFETIKGLNIEAKIIDKLEYLYSKNLKNVLKFSNIINFCNFIKESVELTILLLINLYGILEVTKGSMQLSTLIVFNTILVYFLDPVKNIINLASDYYMAKNALDRANTLFEIKKEDMLTKTDLIINGNIDIHNLSFSYGHTKILNDVNLSIKNGEKVLILGNSGSGKSTLLKILYKYYDVRRGMININNNDINDYSLKDIRSEITYISQNEMLFTDSIKDNIILNRNIKTEEFLNVCKTFCVDKIIENNILGYDMLLEENGINISGGERQRIILARSMLKKSKIVFIDEGLNQIDINLERKILKNSFKNYKNITFVIVSHRLDNMDLYDKVIKIENGQVIDILKRRVKWLVATKK